MSRSMFGGLEQVLASDSAHLAHLWRIGRKDGETFYLTEHDRDITFFGTVYKAAQGITGSAMSSSRSMDADNMDCSILIDTEEITRKDLLAGLFDDADVYVYLVNVDNSLQYMQLAGGWRIGKVSLKGGSFQAELLSKASILEKNIVEVYSPTCRAHFCDDRCKLNPANYTKTGAVWSVLGDGRQRFQDVTRTETTDVFSYGMITWTSGMNAGRTMEVKHYVPATKMFTLFLPMEDVISPGDTYSVLQGCSKDTDACKAYVNIVNFRGEPFVPGSGVIPVTHDAPKPRHVWAR